ncbi:MAG: ABC transporter ATP-binding protein [Bacteroidales bacterium]|nr:ABC transporter ATP-binding protein [Bacteroidales bacterium]MCF8326984.1 ABC transporter ATP-binding protein [Bacteroidales bacterium]
MISAQNINKSYGDLRVLKDIKIEIGDHEIVSIVGASGAGKSTLLHVLGTLDKADTGEVYYDELNLETFSEPELAKFRNKNIGFVFQFHHLLPEFTALENICMPAFIAGVDKKSAFAKAEELLKLMNLSERKDHKPSELSGGEQQRIAVARALINEPKVVLADEPSGNLDSDNSQDLHRIFFDLRDRLSQAFIIVTHNNQLAEMADRKLFMKDGEIVAPE